jgi:hypothetical protein
MSSEIYGRVFDSSTRGWVADVLVNMTAGDLPTYQYVDGSLGQRDASIIDLYNIIDNLPQDVSVCDVVGDLEAHVDDASIHFLMSDIPQDPSISETINSLDLHIDDPDIHFEIADIPQDPSIGDLYSEIDGIPQDPSIGDLYSEIESIPQDSSIGDLYADLDTHTGDPDIHFGIGDIPQDPSISQTLTLLDSGLDTKLSKTTDTFTGTLTIQGTLNINGDITQDGSTYITHAEQVNTTKDYILMRDGAITPIPGGSLSGLQITKADGVTDVLLGTGPDAIMRVGWAGDVLQPIATREDAPLDGGYAYWDDTDSQFKTKALEIDGFVRESSLGTDFVWTAGLLDVSINGMDYPYIDGSLAERDSSIQALFNENDSQNTEIGLKADKAYVDSSLAQRLPFVNNRTLLTNQWFIEHDPSSYIFMSPPAGPYSSYQVIKGHNPLLILEKGFTYDVDLVQRFMTVDRDDYVDDSFYKRAYIDGSLGDKISIDAESITSAGTLLVFDRTLGYVHGLPSAPITNNLTVDLTDALIGTVNLVIHQSGTEPTYPATFKKLAGTYDTAAINYIYIQYIDNNNQLYTINQVA